MNIDNDEPSKVCPRCKKEKKMSEFERVIIEGYKPVYCHLCKREKNREQYIKYRDARLEKYAEYKHSDVGRAVMRKAGRAAYRRYPEKTLARSRFRYAVYSGKIEKQPCQECGAIKVEGHHYLGYAKEHWYDVQWLCRKHHWDAHKFSLESRGLV